MAEFRVRAPAELLGAANHAAAQAAVAWLLARGVVSEIETEACADLADLHDLDRASIEATDAADTLLALLTGVTPAADVPAEVLLAPLQRSVAASEDAARAVRRLAQLLLGASQYGAHPGRARAERAAVALLSGMAAGLLGEPTSPADDGPWPAAPDAEALRIALAGAVGRLILEHSERPNHVDVRHHRGEVHIATHPDGAVEVSVGHGAPRRYEPPVRIPDLVDEVVDDVLVGQTGSGQTGTRM